EGRSAPEPLLLNAGEATELTLTFPAQGWIEYDVVDGSGRPSPAQVSFYQGDTRVARVYTHAGKGTIDLAPGDYTVAISRGFEYAIVEQPLTVIDGAATPLAVTLTRLVDTAGY